MKGSWMAVALAAAMFVSGPVFACGGHETRAANDLNQMYGNTPGVKIEAAGDHDLKVTAPDGTVQHFSGTEQNMVSGAQAFLAQHTQSFEDYAG